MTINNRYYLCSGNSQEMLQPSSQYIYHRKWMWTSRESIPSPISHYQLVTNLGPVVEGHVSNILKSPWAIDWRVSSWSLRVWSIIAVDHKRVTASKTENSPRLHMKRVTCMYIHLRVHQHTHHLYLSTATPSSSPQLSPLNVSPKSHPSTPHLPHQPAMVHRHSNYRCFHCPE